MRYRSAAMAEFWRALKTLKALQAEQARARAAAGADRADRPPARRAGAGARRRPDRQRAAHADRPRTERTRAPHGIPAARAAHRRPRPARARSALDAERTRAAPGETGARGHEGSRAGILLASERMQPFNLEQCPMRWRRIGSLHCLAHREKIALVQTVEQPYPDDDRLWRSRLIGCCSRRVVRTAARPPNALWSARSWGAGRDARVEGSANLCYRRGARPGPSDSSLRL